MVLSEARKRANKKWNDENLKERYDRIQLVVPKGKKELIASYAKSQNEKSVNDLLNRLIRVEMSLSEDEWKERAE